MTHTQTCGLYKVIQRGGEGEVDQRSEPEYNQHFVKRYIGGRGGGVGSKTPWIIEADGELRHGSGVSRHLDSTLSPLERILLSARMKGCNI